jgi:hypothetical protein
MDLLRLDSLMEKVQAIELAQSLMIYPSQSQPRGSSPMNSDIHDSDAQSRPSSPIPSDQGDKESSVAEPGTSEDLAAVLDAASDTPTLSKRNSVPGKTRRDSFYVRQLGSHWETAVTNFCNFSTKTTTPAVGFCEVLCLYKTSKAVL